MEKKRFTFIIPNTTWFEKRYWHNIPYVEALLTAVLKQNNYDVDTIDANLNNFNEAELAEKIKTLNPDFIGIGEMALEYRDCVHKSFEIVKKIAPNIITIIGGVYPTLSPEIVTKDSNIDYFVFGEGEERLIKLLKAIETKQGFKDIDGLAYRAKGKLISQPMLKGGIQDLDSLPLPDYSNFDMQKYMNYQQKFTQNFTFKQLPVGITMTSRGCPFRCTFCSSKELYSQKIRVRSPENVLKEVDMLINNYGMKEIIFIDDSLLWPKDRAIKIMDGLIERRKKGYNLTWKSNNLAIHHINDDEILDKMKESGCYQIIASIESGSSETLKRMKKPVDLKMATEALRKIQKRNFDNVSSNFVIGMPGDTWDDIRQTFNYVDEMMNQGLLDYAVFHIATPFPGTELYEICKEKGYLPKDFDFSKSEYYGFGKGVIKTPEFSPEELQILRAYEWDRLNFRTLEQKEKIAKMVDITLEELENWRKETRKKVGLNIKAIADRKSFEK